MAKPSENLKSRNVQDFQVHLGKGVGSDFRNHWWDFDYVQLLAKRAKLNCVKKALDVGCGTGHWTRVIYPFLDKNAHMIGIDCEESFLEQATKDTQEKLANADISYQIGDVYKLPFEENTFDLGTCQLVLMHLADVSKALVEMLRVLKPGGVLVLVEPNKAVNSLFQTDSVLDTLTIEEKLERMKLYLMCVEGKVRSGHGFEDIGPRLPEMLGQFKNVDVEGIYNSDRVFDLRPPYSTPREQSQIQFMSTLLKDNSFGTYTKERGREYFCKASNDTLENTEKEFNRLWKTVTKYNNTFFEQLKKGTLSGVFGATILVTIGRKQG